MNPWEHLMAVINILGNCQIPANVNDEFDVMVAMTNALHQWRQANNLALRIVNDQNQRAMAHGLPHMPHTPVPVLCPDFAFQSWPDIGIYPDNFNVRLIEYAGPLEDHLVAVEIKLLKAGEGGSQIHAGIGQAAINALAYRHSILAIVDRRPPAAEQPRRGVYFTAETLANIAHEHWNFNVLRRLI